MKKLVAAALVGTMVFSLCACGNTQTATTEVTTDTAAEAADTEAAEGDTEAADTEAAGGVLVMVTNAEFPPYEYHEGDQIVGIDAEIAQAIAEDMGMELQIEDMAFDSLIAAVQSGKADFAAAGMTVTEDRLENVNFTDTYASATQVVIVKEDSEIASPDDLAAKTVGVQLGTTGDLYAADIEDVEIERYNKGFEAVQALTQDKIDAVIIDGEPAKVFVEQNPGLKILDEAFTEEEYAIAIAKDNTDLLERMNASLQNLKEAGVLDEIVAKYITADEGEEASTEAVETEVAETEAE